MSWTPCERCGEACREHGPLCDYCEKDDRKPERVSTGE
jgi:hypothetical protein